MAINKTMVSFLNPIKIIDIAFAVVGALLIATCDYFLWFNLSADTKFNAIILWLTAVIVFRYTAETYDLRILSQRQLEQQEKVMMNEFLPIIVPIEKDGTAVLQGDAVTKMVIHNSGKGPAKDVSVTIGNILVWQNMSIDKGEEEVVYISVDRKQQVKGLIDKRNSEIKAKIEYRDIYNRELITKGIIFDFDKVDANTRYILRKGRWDFNLI